MPQVPLEFVVEALKWFQRIWNYEFLTTDFTNATTFTVTYVSFNAIEALIWFAVGSYVLIRYARRGKSAFNLMYAAAFAIFAISDLLEIVGYSLALLMLKAVTLGLILACRAIVLAEYPGAKL